MFILPFLLYKLTQFLYFYIGFTHMGQKRPVFISYAMSIMTECFFDESLKEMHFIIYYSRYSLNILFLISTNHCLFSVFFLLYKQTQFLYFYINFEQKLPI